MFLFEFCTDDEVIEEFLFAHLLDVTICSDR